jgi:hypothetical protein
MAVSLNGAPGTEQMISQSVPAGFTNQRLYDTYWQYPGSSKLTRASAMNQMDAGYGIVNHLGHGFRYTMSCGDASLVNADADALTNGSRSFVLMMANCAAVAFDYNCLAERFLLNPGGGAAGIIGAARSVSAGLIVTYNQAFYRQLFQFGHVHLADALDAMRLERTSLAELDGSDRWIHFSLNALGDPEMTIFTGAVRTAALAHAATVALAPDTLVVGVTANATPVAGAQLCATKGDEVYAAGATDGAGQVHLVFTPETAGPLYLTVSGQNLATHTDTLQVLAATGPTLALQGFTLDDDASAPSNGNGNGIADAGETVALTVTVANHGGTATGSVTGAMSSPDPRITIVQGGFSSPSIAPGGTHAGNTPLVVQLGASIPDGTSFDLPLVWNLNGQPWRAAVHLQVCGPRLEVTRVVVTSPPVAPVNPQSTASIAVEAKNYGSGIQQPLLVTLTSSSPNVQVTRDSMQFVAVPPLAVANGAPALEYRNVSTPAAVTLHLRDTYGRTQTLRVDPTPPPAPPRPLADLSIEGTVRLTWTVSAAADHYGYHVFRSPTGANTWTRLTPDATRPSDYYDSGITSNAHYDYYVVDVDSSRQWSTPSPTLSVNTVVSALPGWPLDMTDPTASSVAVGDVDGDGTPEVVVGDNGVYVWHGNGLELIDGDHNPTTYGVFSTASGVMNASVTLANLDGAPGLEILAASWATNRLYAWRANGTLLPGWPREPANGGNVGYWGSPAVGDVDGDGSPEVVIVSKDGWLYAWHANGTPLLPGNGGVRVVGAWTQTTPALADLDGDGKREMIVSGALARVDVIRWDGTDFPGWPRSLFALGKTSPVVGDVNGDGDLEIVVGSESDHLYVFASDGTLLPGWPRLVPQDSPDFGPSPALGDLDGDGRLEIVTVSNKNPFTLSKLFVFDATAQPILEKQLELNSQASPVLADVDGDGYDRHRARRGSRHSARVESGR